MRSSELDYDLPQELVAQHPVEPRDASRLLVHDRSTGETRHRSFRELPGELDGHLVVVNDTRVVPARLALRRASGGAVEVLLLEHLGGDRWEALARPSRRLRAGEVLTARDEDSAAPAAPSAGDGAACDDQSRASVTLAVDLGGGRWEVLLDGTLGGGLPLPPYIHEAPADPERYQTVYAAHAGSAAAPTAGLHFTPGLLAQVDHERVTLHVGLDTFRPLTAERLDEHELHGERYSVTPRAWARIERADRVLAVGTTTTRVLETLARGAPLEGRSHLFVTPGFAFRRVDALLTNFHLPRTTLLALVMAFAGVERTRELYALAIRERYRFYSFGDAILIL
ncbi:MAG: tRNA preQ1(34) S-adenosylmethionine ribosyltransferase-isomerase QueA [Actinobacteria bacterium]|nr:tRNA preQ1(34) S-adenosylmethionine ribosyltransferase-isomerase QueA [Actinomycetota bacterium]